MIPQRTKSLLSGCHPKSNASVPISNQMFLKRKHKSNVKTTCDLKRDEFREHLIDKQNDTTDDIWIRNLILVLEHKIKDKNSELPHKLKLWKVMQNRQYERLRQGKSSLLTPERIHLFLRLSSRASKIMEEK